MIECMIVALGILADQLSKLWMAKNFVGMTQVIVPGALSYSYVENTGAAFGMLGSSTIVLSAVTGLLAAALLYVLIHYRRIFSRLSRVALAFMLSGAIGNLIDRVLRGYVVDFVKFDFVRFAVFNIADICITMGTIFLILSMIFLEMEKTETFKTSGDGQRPENP